MARYILIDNNSGYVFCDTADLPDAEARVWRELQQTPVLACQLCDRTIGETMPRAYIEIGHNPRSTVTGYHVYRADIDGSEAVAVVTDGQDRETIEAVERDCRYVAFVEARSAE